MNKEMNRFQSDGLNRKGLVIACGRAHMEQSKRLISKTVFHSARCNWKIFEPIEHAKKSNGSSDQSPVQNSIYQIQIDRLKAVLYVFSSETHSSSRSTVCGRRYRADFNEDMRQQNGMADGVCDSHFESSFSGIRVGPFTGGKGKAAG
ncbi:hypothetical protein EWI07_03840 [Sporolactobacillus sp. THM7-4]|nr:hypothetical protein EWI07_03840 [Sporolactobacillus sp. THM7-4]